MLRHPVTESPARLVVAVVLLAVAAAVLWGLLACYGQTSAGSAAAMAAAYTALLGAALFLYGFAVPFLRFPAARVVAGVLGLVLVLLPVWGVSIAAGWCDGREFRRLMPLLAVYGTLNWTVGALGYRVVQRGKTSAEASPADDEAGEEPLPALEKQETIDRISVKKGGGIHIVRVAELRYLTADGDYVMLFTDTEKFLKEQTMKYFETHLPDHFVRIHRSCIVNVDEIARVELFGKESYRVRLKNGTALRASVSGYRLLRQRLGL